MRRLFISYAHNSSDRQVAQQLYGDLVAAGHAPWLDEFDLLPGDDFELRIEQEIPKCRYFLALMSSRSLSKTGFVQKELRLALDVLDLMPVDERFLLPLRLDDCHPQHRRLALLHWVDLFPDYQAGLSRLLNGLDSPTALTGRLYADVGLELPVDLATWDEEVFCRYVRDTLAREAWIRAERDYENVSVGDRIGAVRERSRELLVEVARRHGFEGRLRDCLERAP